MLPGHAVVWGTEEGAHMAETGKWGSLPREVAAERRVRSQEPPCKPCRASGHLRNAGGLSHPSVSDILGSAPFRLLMDGARDGVHADEEEGVVAGAG